MVQRENTLAAQCQQENVAKRNFIRTQTHNMLSYSTMASQMASVPFAQRITSFLAISDRFMKKTVKERGQIIEEVKFCYFAQHGGTCLNIVACSANSNAESWTEVLCGERSTTVVYADKNLSTASQCSSTYRQKKATAWDGQSRLMHTASLRYTQFQQAHLLGTGELCGLDGGSLRHKQFCDPHFCRSNESTQYTNGSQLHSIKIQDGHTGYQEADILKVNFFAPSKFHF